MLPDHNGFLWIKGKPGAGKSTLMKFALNHALSTMEQAVVVSFFFHARGGQLEKSTLGAYQSILLQLFESIPGLGKCLNVLRLSRVRNYSDYQWTLATVQQVLEKVIQELGEYRVVCFIDALDECDEDDVRNMVKFFWTSSKPSFRVCFASRPYPNISIRKCRYLDLDTQPGHQHDIKVYLDSQLDIGQEDVAISLRKEVQAMSSGIFMWVCLAVQMLNRSYARSNNLRVVRKRLREIPEELHQLFLSILQRDTEDMERMILCIQWVLFAGTSLSPGELYCLMLFELEPETFFDIFSGNTETHICYFDAHDYVLASSKGLVQITRGRYPKVEFIHESVRDFLLDSRGLAALSLELGKSHERLKQSCLRYYQDPHVNEQWRKECFSLHERSGSDVDEGHCIDCSKPLDYIVHALCYHADSAQGAGIDQEEFLETFPLEQHLQWQDDLGLRLYNGESQVSLLYILASKDAQNLIRIASSVLSCFEVVDALYASPFFAALVESNTAATRAFLEAHIMTLDSEVIWSLYEQSVINRHRNLEEPEIDESWIRAIPSPWLDKVTNQELAALLLKDQELDVHSPSCARNLALSCVTWELTSEDVNTLLDGRSYMLMDKPPDAKLASHGQQWAPLLCARELGERPTRLLLSMKNVDVTKQGLSPLHCATLSANKGMLEVLLERNDVGVNLQDKGWGGTALMMAVNGEDLDSTRLLLRANNLAINLQDFYGYTALHLAVLKGHAGCSEEILTIENIDVNIRNGDGSTPLYLACRRGHKDTVRRLLMKKGIDVNLPNLEGWTPLATAVRDNHLPVVQLLLDTGKVDIQDVEKILAVLEEIGYSDENETFVLRQRKIKNLLKTWIQEHRLSA
jgi:ankyrin repeat protein